MKNLFRISFLLVILCFAGTVYADGDLSTGNKTCTQNCLVGPINQPPETIESNNQDELTLGTIYIWVYNQISDLVN
jgi:hypothetical protein